MADAGTNWSAYYNGIATGLFVMPTMKNKAKSRMASVPFGLLTMALVPTSKPRFAGSN